MSKIDDGGTAFPVVSDIFGHHSGMSLRDWFAGQVVSGMVAGGRGLDISVEQFAKSSYAIADAMIAERNKEQS